MTTKTDKMDISLVVLAAGESKRFQGGIKQLEPVGPAGETLIDYAVRDGIKAGFSRVIFIIQRSMEEAFRSSVGSRIENIVEVQYAYADQERETRIYRDKPWGTGYSLLCAREYIDGAFGVINADDYYGPEAYKLLYRYLESNANAMRIAMVGYLLKNTLSAHGGVTRGICICNSQGELVDLHETENITAKDEVIEASQGDMVTEFSGDTLVSMNMWGMAPGFIELLDKDFSQFIDRVKEQNANETEFLLPDAIARMLRNWEITVEVLPTEEQWFGITYREDAQDVARRIATSRGV